MENNFQIASASVSDKGLSEKRPHNEDSFLELGEQGLFVVADGVGGAQAGDVASQMAVEILGEAFLNMKSGSDAEDVMKMGIERANAAIFQMSHDLPQLSTMATTIVALHLSGNIATIGHVGDSRLYRLDANGNLFRETQDHSVVEEEVRAGRMTATQAAHHPSRNVISRALGAEPGVEVDMKTIMFDPNTSFLLCSDGITRHIDDYEIRDLLLSVSDPQDVCRLMKNICYERGAEDNLTAVIIKVSAEVVNNFSAPQRFGDFEEATVATARARETNTLTVPNSSHEADELPTRDLMFPKEASSTGENFSAQPENFFVEPAHAVPSNGHISEKIGEKISENTSELTSEKISEHTSENFDRLQPVQPVEPVQTYPDAPTFGHSTIETDVKEYRIDEKDGGGIISKALGAILLLLIGSAIGAGAYHYFVGLTPPPAPAPQITEMKTPDIPFSSFEQNRRNVDRNPQQFITANAAAPQDAIDFYLLGRAYLLTAQYPEAKQAFTESKNRLGQTDEVNSKTLANEIAMSLAIINDPFAQKAFEKDMLEGNGQNAVSNTSAANTANSGVTPNR
ncbi:MAG: protein phosphatase [Acidobacteria bacterium]|jgi:protein phosphatase|nr:protein phosphatase [Acidobacteriota bacterium]